VIAPRTIGFWLQTAALLLLLISFVLPPLHLSRPIYDVIAVMDITGSMNVRDEQLNGAPASRIAFEKSAVRALLGSLPCGSQLGVAIFVERRPLLLLEPIETCENFSVLDSEIAAIDWKMGWDSESHIATSLASAMPMAGTLAADLIFITDGQEEPPLSWAGPPNFAPVRGTTHGLIAGIGGYEFAPIPRFDKQGHEIGVWRPGDVPSETGGIFRGHEYLSAVDEPHLRDLARQTGLKYIHLMGTDDLMTAFAGAVPKRLRPAKVNLQFAAAAAALVLLMATEGSSSFLNKRTKKLLPITAAPMVAG